MTDNFVVLAVPMFFVLMGVEIGVARWQGKRLYRLGDAINSISCGVIAQLFEAVVGLAPLLALYNLAARFAPIRLDPGSIWTWVLAFLCVDFIFYWWHRFNHEYNALWAAHIVHHQSEDYNLSTALRQSWPTSLTSAVFYLPIALLGVPFQVYFGALGLALVYQYWIHTQLIGKLGPFEWVFNTPSHHRVHHGVNPEYVDRNYGGILIVWDRLFGTYAEERAPVIYGTVKPIATWNPIRNNLELWLDLFRGRRRWWVGPDWTPEDPHPPLVLQEYRPEGYRKFDYVCTREQGRRAFALFLVILVSAAVFLNFQEKVPLAARLVVALAGSWGLAVAASMIAGKVESAKKTFMMQ